MKWIIKSMLVAGVIVTSFFYGTCALAASDAISPNQRIIVKPGESFQAALFDARVEAKAAQLQTAWRRTGKPQPEASATVPRILSGQVLSTSVDVGNPLSFPSLSFAFTTGASGLSYAQFVFSSPNGDQTIGISYGLPVFKTKGVVEFANPPSPSLYSQPGVWTLSAAAIYDNAGNAKTYNARQLASLFSVSSFTLINTGVYDATPPTVSSGSLESSTISLSSSALPQMVANFVAADSGSGLYEALVFIQPPGQAYYFAEIAPAPLPLSSGTVTSYTSFYPSDATGAYTIVQVQVCDVAFNCFTVQSSRDVTALLGTTTITVTN